jgi:hypothetical protein
MSLNPAGSRDSDHNRAPNSFAATAAKTLINFQLCAALIAKH